MLGSENGIADLIQESIAIKSALRVDSTQLSLINRIAGNVVDAVRQGNKVIFCGDGDSFADSIHLAAEFVSRFQMERRPLAGVALGANNSILTSVGNDYSHAEEFLRELTTIGKAGDVLIAISTSGNSENMLRAVMVAKEIGVRVFGITGENGGRLVEVAECLKVPPKKTAQIQESHILVGHIICKLAEDALFSGSE